MFWPISPSVRQIIISPGMWSVKSALPPSRCSQSEWIPVVQPTRNVSSTAPTNKTLTSTHAPVSLRWQPTPTLSLFLSLDDIPSRCMQRGGKCGTEFVGNVMAVKYRWQLKIGCREGIAQDTHTTGTCAIIVISQLNYSTKPSSESCLCGNLRHTTSENNSWNSGDQKKCSVFVFLAAFFL